jgi:hypothetical protein
MKGLVFFLLVACLVVPSVANSAAQPYDLVFSTFFGGSSGEGIRDVETDRRSNVYVAGTTRSADFPTTPGAFDRRVDTNSGKTRWGYNSDILVAKFSPVGKLIWSTVIGGPGSEEAYGLEIDSKGYVVVHGRGAAGSPITPGVYQEQFKGCGGDDPGNPHGTAQNAYICKLTPDGSSIVWATYLGGSDYDSIEASIDVDEQGYVYVGCQTRSRDIPTTEGAFDRTHNGGVDWYVAKLLPDGSDIVYGTYIGDEGNNWLNTHNLVVDRQGNCYSSTCAFSSSFPTTPGAVQAAFGGGKVDWGIVKLSPTKASQKAPVTPSSRSSGIPQPLNILISMCQTMSCGHGHS